MSASAARPATAPTFMNHCRGEGRTDPLDDPLMALFVLFLRVLGLSLSDLVRRVARA